MNISWGGNFQQSFVRQKFQKYNDQFSIFEKLKPEHLLVEHTFLIL